MITPRPVSRRRVVTLLGAGTAISLLGDSTLYTVLPRPEIAAQAGVGLATVGLLLGTNRVVRLLTNGAAGMLYDRLPRRGLLVASLFLGALSTLIFAVGYGPAPLFISRLLWGAAWSGIWVGGNAYVLDASTPRNRGRLSGQYQMWFFLGAGGAALFGGVLTDLLGFRQGLAIGGALTLLSALVWLLVLPAMQPAARLAHPALAAAEPFPWQATIFTAIPLFVSRLVFTGAMTATSIIWLSGLLGDRLLLAGAVLPIATVTGAFVALRALVSVLGASTAGYHSDRTGYHWRAVAAALAAGAVGTWLAASPLAAVAVAGGLLAAVTAGGVQALVLPITSDYSDGTQRGRVLSAVYTFADLGSALGPPVALGLIRWLPVAGIYRLCAVLLAATVLFALWRAAIERAGDLVTSEH